MMKNTPIEKCIAAVRQGNTILRGGRVADEAEEELRTLRSQIDKLQSDTRATPPRAEVDVESVVRSVRATLAAWTHPGMSEHDRSVCVEQAIRRALARATGGNDAT